MIGKAGNKSVEFSFEFDFNLDTCSGVDFSFPLHRLAAKTKLSEMELQRITGINAGTEFANFQVKGIGMANTYMANAKISLYEIEN